MTGVKPTQFLVTPDDMIAKLEFAKTCLENPMIMETAIDWSIQMITAMQADTKKAADRIEQLEAELQAQRESTDIFRKLASPKTQEPEVAFKHDIFGARQSKCATDGCDGQPIDHIIMGGIGSDYCMDCADKIIAKYKGGRS